MLRLPKALPDALQLPKPKTQPKPGSALEALRSQPFSTIYVAGAISTGCTAADLRKYLQAFDRQIVEGLLSSPYLNHLAVFYAAWGNHFEILELLLEYGADPNMKGCAKMTLLELTIIWSYWTKKNVDKTVALLLSHGASPKCIPRELWVDYIKTPTTLACSITKWRPSAEVTDWSSIYSPSMIATPSSGDEEKSAMGVRNDVTAMLKGFRQEQEDPSDTPHQWTNALHRLALETTLNLTIRYLLNRADQRKPHTTRLKEVAALYGCPRLLRMPYHLIGQDHALEVVMNKILASKALNRNRPLVLAFAGMSGHGKTELATQLGFLLGTSLLNVDVSKVHSIQDLFGHGRGYQGGLEGNQLNNFLASHDKQRCVIFLDEFDKTQQQVRESLLTILERGTTTDRRTDASIDISKSIWILATNKGDSLLSSYYEKHMKGKTDAVRRKVSIEPLQHSLTTLFREQYTAAVAGRISAFVPFFPFTRDEAAVVSHTFLQALANRLRMPIDLDIDDPITLGHILLTLADDGKLCSHLADTNYMPMRELGARVLQNSVDHLAEKLFQDYVQIEDEITEDTNNGPLLGYTMQLHPVEDSHEVAVFQTEEEEDMDEADTLGRHFAGLSFENADAPKLSGSVIGQKRGLSDADESD